MMRDLRRGATDTHESIKKALVCAPEPGGSAMRPEAIAMLELDKRTGAASPPFPIDQLVTFSAPRLGGMVTLTEMSLIE